MIEQVWEPDGAVTRTAPIVPAVSIPPFLDLPPGVVRTTLETGRGAFAALDNQPLVHANSGNPRTVLLLPGFTGSKEDFLALLEPLGTAGYRGVAIDLSGQYETPGPEAAGDYSLASFAADVLAVAEALGTPVDLVGHSLGGLVAREAVLADPLTVRSLTLMGSGPCAIPDSHHHRMQLFASVLAEHGLDVVWSAKQALEEEEGVAPPSDARTHEFLTKRFLANTPGSLLAMVDILCSEPDRTDELATLAPTTLVLTGERDDVWPPEDQQAMAAKLAAEFIRLADVGHSPAAEAPIQTIQVLVEFWASSAGIEAS